MDEGVVINRLYEALMVAFGPQLWWPGETPFEVMVGAVLTQNTGWRNVEKAIDNLKRVDLLDAHRLDGMPEAALAALIRPAGYFNVKSRRLKALVRWLVGRFDGRADRAFKGDLAGLRKELLAVNGVGPETADSILLYAGRRRTFVIDAYTRRVLSRHGFVAADATYEAMKRLMEAHDVRIYNEFHALLVKLGKEFCRPRPRCPACPLRECLASLGRPLVSV